MTAIMTPPTVTVTVTVTTTTTTALQRLLDSNVFVSLSRPRKSTERWAMCTLEATSEI